MVISLMLIFCIAVVANPHSEFKNDSAYPSCYGDIQETGETPDNSPRSSLSAEEAKELFEHFKKHEGTWRGTSTKGWTEESSVKVIANGSVIQMTSFDAHPNETMLTLIHLDGDRLLLTHYCVARNQPRLVASKIEDEGKKITFEFLDATNLSSRDKGHMDKMVHRCTDENSYSTQWTWYQNGKEDWMEEIILVRKHEN